MLACVRELGETGSSLKPARCDDTTGNHQNHFLSGVRVCALSSRTEQTGHRPAWGAGTLFHCENWKTSKPLAGFCRWV